MGKKTQLLLLLSDRLLYYSQIKVEGVAVWWLDWHNQVCGQPVVVVLPKRELCSVLCTSPFLLVWCLGRPESWWGYFAVPY